MAENDRWTVRLDPPVLLPGRTARVAVQYSPDRDHESRGVSAVLRCVERYRYSRTETRTGANGVVTSHRVTKTGQEELARLEATLAGPGRFVRGQPETWQFELEVPELGPATFEGDVLRCDWTLEAKVDIPMRLDEGTSQPVRVAQPTALLRAGVVATGQYGLFEEAPANVERAVSAASSVPTGSMRTRTTPGCRRLTCPMAAGVGPSMSSWPGPGRRTSTTFATSPWPRRPSSRPGSGARSGVANARLVAPPRLRPRPGGRSG
jgi:hypothetical protein